MPSYNIEITFQKDTIFNWNVFQPFAINPLRFKLYTSFDSFLALIFNIYGIFNYNISYKIYFLFHDNIIKYQPVGIKHWVLLKDCKGLTPILILTPI